MSLNCHPARIDVQHRVLNLHNDFKTEKKIVDGKKKCKCFAKIPYKRKKKFCSNISLVNFSKKKKQRKRKKMRVTFPHI